MSGISARLTAANPRPAFDAYYRRSEQAIERAALSATDRGSTLARNRLRESMASAGLGRLGQAIGSTSDLKRGRGVVRRGAGFSAGGFVHLRTRSERTVGAIEAYTEGAEIVPRRGRWLWYPSPEAPRIIGAGKNKRRLTPALYKAAGEPLGPLFQIKGINGWPLLAVADVGKSAVGARGGRVRSLTKRGAARRGDRAKQISVLFIAIPRTSRAARVNARAIIQAVVAQDLPALFATELRKEAR